MSDSDIFLYGFTGGGMAAIVIFLLVWKSLSIMNKRYLEAYQNFKMGQHIENAEEEITALHITIKEMKRDIYELMTETKQ